MKRILCAALLLVLLLGLTPESITNDLMKFVAPKQTLRDKVLIAKGKKDGMLQTSELNALLEKTTMTTEQIMDAILQQKDHGHIMQINGAEAIAQDPQNHSQGVGQQIKSVKLGDFLMQKRSEGNGAVPDPVPIGVDHQKTADHEENTVTQMSAHIADHG